MIMNNFKKEYLSEIKAILPIKSKRERIYLKKLSSDIEALIQEEHISSKKMLYDIYGIPSEVVHNYLSSLGIEYIVKRIKVSSHIKLAIFITIILAFIATITYCIYQHNVYRIMQSQEDVISEEIIQED